MTDDELLGVVVDDDMRIGDRVKAQFERQRREALSDDDPLGLIDFDRDPYPMNKKERAYFFFICFSSAVTVACFGVIGYSLFS